MKKSVKNVAFDLGASGGKVILGCFNGSRIEITEIYRFSNSPIRLGKHIYWDFLQLFEEVKRGLQLAYKEAGGEIASIGVDTWGTDCALIDRDGNLIENPHSYRDPRTNGMMAKVFEIIPRQEIYEKTGVQFMQFNTLFQLYSMAVDDSMLLEAADTFLMIPDLFNFYLSGNKVCEFTNATTTQFFDPFSNDWSRSIFEALNLPTKILPPIIQPGSIMGDLSSWICEDLGIKPLPVVAVATHDTASAASVVPSLDNDYAFLSSGTWSLLGSEENVPVINQEGFNHNFSSYGGACHTFLIWKNIQALWLLQECMRVWATEGRNISYEDLIIKAEQADSFGSILDSDDITFVTPGNFPSKIQDYCLRTGQEVPKDEGSITRCILESLALKYRYTFERLQQVVGKQLEQIFVIGGGSRNLLLNRLTAEATGVFVNAGPAEASSIGNIMLQLMALGELDSIEDSRRVIKASFETTTYEAQRTDAWDEAYSKFLELISQSKTYNL